MKQDIYYSLRFNLNERAQNLGNLFSSINFFAELYGRLDNLLVSALPLKLAFSRSLKDFGENSFLFVFKDHIIYPDQFPLGHQPDLKDVEIGMNSSRKLFSEFFLKGFLYSTVDLKSKLDTLGEKLDFGDLISYRSLNMEELDSIIVDFQNARNFLDSENGVILFE
jgi:hypothetical protein